MEAITKPRGLLLPGGTTQIRLLLSIAERGEGVLLVPIYPQPPDGYENDSNAPGHGTVGFDVFVDSIDGAGRDWLIFKAPYRIGETRWLKERWAADRCYDHISTANEIPRSTNIYHGSGIIEGWHMPRPVRQMPAWASRLTITFRSVTAKQLRDVSEAEAQAAGALPDGWEDDIPGGPVCTGFVGRHTLESMWPSLHTSPFDPAAWVWVYGVEVCRK